MSDKNTLLRQIPQVNDILTHPDIVRQAEKSGHISALEVSRDVLEEIRGGILRSDISQIPARDEIAQTIVCNMRLSELSSLRRVINATGIILHTNLGRAPLSKSAVDAVRDAARGYCTLEYDVETGARGSRQSHVESLLVKITGAEAAMAVNNNASAVMLALSALAKSKEVIVSRGELIEIGGAFRIPDVMEQSGCILKEVGTTNRTRISDYEKAISGSETGAIFKAHTSNFKIVGFTEETTLEELVSLGKKHDIPVIYDIGSGCVFSLDGFGIIDEPCAGESLTADPDIICFSGDKLLGGPQAGILIGKNEYISKMKKHPLARALRMDKLSLAALEATLRLYLDPERAKAEVPVLRMISTTPDELKRRASSLAQTLAGFDGKINVVESKSQIGGGSTPGQELPSYAAEIAPESMSVTLLEQRLRGLNPPVIARISHDKLLLDMRTVEDDDLAYISDALSRILKGGTA